jgi:hypothetical protein
MGLSVTTPVSTHQPKNVRNTLKCWWIVMGLMRSRRTVRKDWMLARVMPDNEVGPTATWNSDRLAPYVSNVRSEQFPTLRLRRNASVARLRDCSSEGEG